MLRDVLAAIPMSWVTVLIVDLTLVILWWVLMLPREFIYRNAPDTARWRDLRLWAAAILLVQINLYIVF